MENVDFAHLRLIRGLEQLIRVHGRGERLHHAIHLPRVAAARGELRDEVEDQHKGQDGHKVELSAAAQCAVAKLST